MTLGTIARFQFGNAAAIRAVAENRNALWVGVVLVLLTAIARNYDQLYFSDTPRWLFGPLLFSIVSGSLLFLVVYSCFVRRHIGNRKEVRTLAQWRSFMTLFWMTAPVAWIYAIPTERLFDSYRATQGKPCPPCDSVALAGAADVADRFGGERDSFLEDV